MSRRNESIVEMILDDLTRAPWWVSLILAAVVFVGLRFVVPAFTATGPAFKTFAAIVWLPFCLLFLFIAAISALRSFHKRRLLDRQTGIDSIRALPWKQFEELLGEAYRRRGYAVTENETRGADGGVDLYVEKGGNRYLVQCKQWKTWKVPVSVVREMFGIMTAKRASGVVIVTSGMFTQEAKDFAADKPIDLVEGQALVEMIRGVQANPPPAARKPPATKEPAAEQASKVCPLCGRPLELKTARHGKHAGTDFWGCTGYPTCKYILK